MQTLNASSLLLPIYGKYMHLKIYVNSNNTELKSKYYHATYSNNMKLYTHVNYIDAGFDIFIPKNQELTDESVNKLDYEINCSAKIIEGTSENHRAYNSGYYMYPRSSLSKSPLRLANNVGIIDAGYRGRITGMFDCLISSHTINAYDRNVQICAPGLIPIYVELVNSLEDLSIPTARGIGGFGSTGV